MLLHYVKVFLEYERITRVYFIFENVKVKMLIMFGKIDEASVKIAMEEFKS